MNKSPAEATAPTSGDARPHASRNLLHETKVLIRKNPARALAIAVGAGFVLQSAPVGRLVGGLLRVSFALLQPALMIAGGVKVWEKIQRRQIL
jgi:hypothetical protein